MPQKFKIYDRVKIDDDLGPSMSHFTSGVEAIVLGSYADQFGGRDTEDYTLYIKGKGRVSWYYGYQLTLIAKDGNKKLKKWKKKAKTLVRKNSNLDWIFKHGKALLISTPAPTVLTLAACLEISEGDLWGSQGEGITYYSNAMRILTRARPYLESGDKEGWLKYCEALLHN